MHRWAAWNILFRLHEFAKGHPTYRILREMEESDRLSASGLEEFRQIKLRQFLEYCYAHIPFVRDRMQERGLEPHCIREPRDLLQLPCMTKDDIRKHRSGLQSDIARHLIPFTTGGSTGEPLIFDLSKRRIAGSEWPAASGSRDGGDFP